jgi:cell division protein ZapB
MINELDALENKVAKVVSLCRELRAENDLLRQQFAAAASEKKALAVRLETARDRIEQLVQRLPENKVKV